MMFRDIPGQSTLKARLLEQAKSQRIPHAQMLVGPSGLGGLPLALAFAQYLVCKNPGDQDACGSCAACTKTAKWTHPDIHFNFPIINVDKKNHCSLWMPEWRKALLENPWMTEHEWLHYLGDDNKLLNIPATECAEILKKFSLKSFEGGYKIIIFWMPEYLGNDGNRLLKFIEEPPEQTIVLMVAESEQRILNTILSRLQVYRMQPVHENELTQFLGDHHGLVFEEAKVLAQMSYGNYKEALRMMGEPNLRLRAFWEDWVSLLLDLGTQPQQPQGWIKLHELGEQFSKWSREMQKQFFEGGIQWMEEQIAGGMRNNMLNLHPFISSWDTAMMDAFQRKLNRSHYEIDRYANPRLLFSALSIFAMRLSRNKALVHWDQGIELN